MNMYQNAKNSNILAFKAIISVNWCLSCWTKWFESSLVAVASKNSVKVTLRAKDYDPGQSNWQTEKH